MADFNPTEFEAAVAKAAETMKPFFDERRAVWEREGPAATAAFEATGATLDCIGGNCPVQAEGDVDGQPFYFRARGCGWSLDIGPKDQWHGRGSWSIYQDYGTWPDAGWMHDHEALAFIVAGIEAYRARPPAETAKPIAPASQAGSRAPAADMSSPPAGAHSTEVSQ